MSLSIFAPTADSPGASSSPYAVRQKRQSAGQAWVFSLFVPGLGQMRSGAMSRGRNTLFFFIASIVVAIVGEGDYRWFAIRLALMIQAFAGLDAYSTAREYNRGIDVDADANPRVAAILNLTTSGFGYVYLGGNYGFGTIILINILRRAFTNTLPILVELLALGIAIHAWMMAVKARNEIYPPDKRPLVFETSVNPALPIIAACMVLMPYYLLVIVGQIAVLMKLGA